MPDDADLEALVPLTYIDASRRHRSVSPGARAAVLAAMGPPTPGPPPVAVARRGAALATPGELTLEDGTRVGLVSAVPPDAPLGYHRLVSPTGRDQLLITGPGRCFLPPDLREWGWTVQMAATRSRRSWGIGDLGDLRELAAWSASVGAGFVAVSPLMAPNPGPDPDPSPYFPSTRRWGNPIHLRIDELPGAAAVDDIARQARALNAERLVDRRRVLALKTEGLERAWAARAFDAGAFEAWRGDRGLGLEHWGVYCVLAERHGADWRRWPEPLRRVDGPRVARLAGEEPERVAFHAWIQWCFDLQLAAASAPLRRVADMPVGFDPGGFDAWEWQEALAGGAAIGVPPDRFNLAGQSWGMPPFVPHRLRDAGYRPFIETVRAQLRHAGGLRIDHVLGLFRQWWVPVASDPADGAYVRQPTDELLEIVALESERAGAVIIGEDLGTVPTGVRPALRRRAVLSTRLAFFERVPPSRYPRLAMAGVTTHDLPTIAGLWSGVDLVDQAAAGVPPDPIGARRLRARLLFASGLASDASAEDVTRALHGALGRSPVAMVAATLEDALRIEERPNLPGTVASQRANWSLALPVPIEGLGTDPRVAPVVAALRRVG